MSVEVQERVALWRVPDPTEPPLTSEEIVGVEQARAERAAGLGCPPSGGQDGLSVACAKSRVKTKWSWSRRRRQIGRASCRERV